MILKNLVFKIMKIKKAAFTLVEVITVLFVISLGMVGALTLISQNIKSQSINEKTMIAYQLAQEGVELIRNFRDTAWNNGTDFCFSDPDGLGNLIMDYLDDSPTAVVGTAAGDLFLDEKGMYLHDSVGHAPSGFNRLLSVSPVSSERPATQVKVVAKVSWEDHGKPYTYSLETQLYDWR